MDKRIQCGCVSHTLSTLNSSHLFLPRTRQLLRSSLLSTLQQIPVENQLTSEISTKIKEMPMLSPNNSIFYYLLITFILSASTLCFPSIDLKPTEPNPAPWPEQFHSILFTNNSKGSLQKVDLWYDWPNGRNFNIIQNQLGKLLYDLEWDNGTSYYYTLDSNKECKVMHSEVGILRPSWLDGATYLGQKYMDGFLCNVWTKVDFIWYYEDVATKRPVYWAFYTGMVAHVMTFEVGRVLQDPGWQAPVYCFTRKAVEEIEPMLDTRTLDGPVPRANLIMKELISL